MLGTDFMSVYSAADLAWERKPELAYAIEPHYQRMQELSQNPEIANFFWSYPPPFLLSVSPLSVFPYSIALFVWLALTAMLCVPVYRSFNPPAEWLVAALAFPALFLNLWSGQNGFLSAALLGASLQLLPTRPFLAGLFCGLLAFKPQFVVVIPVAFLALGAWRALASAALTCLAAIAVTTAVWGTPVWSAFVESLTLARQAILDEGASNYWKMASPQAFAGSLGLPSVAATALQILIAGTILISIWIAWRRFGHRKETCALVVLATLLCAPYSHTYDLVMLGLALLWLLQSRIAQEAPALWENLAIIFWVLPLIHFAFGQQSGIPISAPILAAAFWIVWRRLMREPQEHTLAEKVP